MTANNVIEAKDVVKRFGSKKALDGISIKIEAGRIHVLLGKNGSGKTTLAKVLAGILKPDSGSVCADGVRDTTCDPRFRSQVGFLFDSSAHWNALTGRENAWFFARSFGVEPDQSSERIATLFDQLSLAEVADDPVSTYSFGMRRKLSLVQALAHEPKLLILDEPSIGLDHASRLMIYSLLRARVGKGLSAVVATNDMNEARHMADTVSLIEKGKMLTTGAPDQLVRSLDKNTLIQIEMKIPVSAEAVARLDGVLGVSVREEKDRLELQVLAAADDEQQVTGELLRFLMDNDLAFSKLDFRRPELGDVFLKHTGGER